MQKHRVLIVEDEQDIAGLIKLTLERSGSADAEVVGSGDAALKAVSARPPDLIILDLNLPVLGGLEVCPPPPPAVRCTRPADHHADREEQRDRQGRRARNGSRRLRDEALQPAWVDRAGNAGKVARARRQLEERPVTEIRI